MTIAQVDPGSAPSTHSAYPPSIARFQIGGSALIRSIRFAGGDYDGQRLQHQGDRFELLLLREGLSHHRRLKVCRGHSDVVDHAPAVLGETLEDPADDLFPARD